MITDAQVHIWAASSPERPWPPQHKPPQKTVPFGLVDLLGEMDAAGVARAIIVPPSWEGDRNDLALATAKAYPQRFAVMGRFDFTAQEKSHNLRHWKNQTGMLGIRLQIRAGNRTLLGREGDWFWREAELAAIPIMIRVQPADLHALGELAQRFQGLRLALDHLALPQGKRGSGALQDLPTLLALSATPNIAVKMSALPSYSGQNYPFADLHDAIRSVFDRFGPRRMFWGSDLTQLPCSYRDCIRLFTDALPWLSSEDRGWIMGRAISEWLPWPLSGAQR